MRLRLLKDKMEMVERAALLADKDLAKWIFRSVTTGTTFPTFEAEGAPFGRDLFYDRLHKYFFLLDKLRS